MNKRTCLTLLAVTASFSLSACSTLKRMTRPYKPSSSSSQSKSNKKQPVAKAHHARCHGRMANKPPECRHLDGGYLGLRRVDDQNIARQVKAHWDNICKGKAKDACYPADGIVVRAPGWRYQHHPVSGAVTNRYVEADIFYRVGSECWLFSYVKLAQPHLGGGKFAPQFKNIMKNTAAGHRHYECSKLQKAYNL